MTRNTCCRKCNFYPRPPRGERRVFHKTARTAEHFYPRPPRGERPVRSLHSGFSQGFLSTPSARRATVTDATAARVWVISIHALREESDPGAFRQVVQCPVFLSTPSARRATTGAGGRSYRKGVFLSTPSARRATVIRRFSSARSNNFYPRPPRGERHPLWTIPNLYTKFLSTPSARRATYISFCYLLHTLNFYPRPPRGERQHHQGAVSEVQRISIHALREESDNTTKEQYQKFSEFLSTPSARRATGALRYEFPPINISIHALREESDTFGNHEQSHMGQFLSTPSARRATHHWD